MVALNQWGSRARPPDQADELLAGIATDALQEAQHHALGGALEAGIAEAAHRALHEGVALLGSQGKLDREGPVEESSQLLERLQFCIVHIDHHASHHDRFQPPAQTQTPLETRPSVQTQTPLEKARSSASCRHDVICEEESADPQGVFYACDAFDNATVMITRLSV